MDLTVKVLPTSLGSDLDFYIIINQTTNMKSMAFTFHTDPGHGWLEVSVSDITNIGLRVTDFSECSFRDGNTLYLEEDSDAELFINTWKRMGKRFSSVERYDNDSSFIRDLPRIH